MNPSAAGWIIKYGRDLDAGKFQVLPPDQLYSILLRSGFIYGTSVTTVVDSSPTLSYSEEEITKINLFTALASIYYDTIENSSFQNFIDTLNEFYELINVRKSTFSFLKNWSGKPSEKLESIIHNRIQTTESPLKKNFSHLVTNALLFIDVLAFDHFLMNEEHPIQFASDLENLVSKTVLLALESKMQKNHSDELLIYLFANSVRYTTTSSNQKVLLKDLNLNLLQETFEKQYILDLVSLALWTDTYLDPREDAFVTTLGKKLQVPHTWVKECVAHVDQFITKHKNQIAYFNYSNPAHHFYKHSLRTVRILILRNKKRLLTEITESKDLVILLKQSTLRDLSEEERKKVRQQLLDICKSIPSFAIFIMPGGSLLLPVLIKFIPKLLPSAFNENTH
ncbi:LETM1-related biofilm-associated protein [Aquimarina sp. ERC-38]|uniref:LETM1-related biofilm-associated protein n=1 Tax=Aquimarina sp. ERC-38 TaxID=2949996 RepID=UPI002246CDD4|nr:LETM1-related biofilm-associated protein [Aquimarina sp. ERC-38]UZO80326.1 LETM1-related biofilm-associated protein [Aquimarina sp. ERC-38]